MKGKSITLSIIIVNYKVQVHILACIQSIIDSKPKTQYEIIIVDNDEKPTLGKIIKKQFFDCIYIANDKNVGFGAANNIGANHASGAYLFFLNPDTLLVGKTIDILLNSISKDKKTGIVAPLLLHENMQPFRQQGSTRLTVLNSIVAFSFLNKFFPDNPISRKYWLLDWDKMKTIYVDTVPGTAFIISKFLFKKINGFDENFFLYFEEEDLCERVANLGYKLSIEPQAKIIHFFEKSTVQRSDKNIIFKQSRLYFFKKHFGYLNAYILEGFLSIRKKHLFVLLIILFLLLTI